MEAEVSNFTEEYSDISWPNSPKIDGESSSSSSSDEEDESTTTGQNGDGKTSEINAGPTKKRGNDFRIRRRNIRKIFESEKLSNLTLDAQQQERERLQRVVAADEAAAAAPPSYYPQFPPCPQLTAEDVAEINKRNQIWNVTEKAAKVPSKDVVTIVSSDDEAAEGPSLQAKRRKQSFLETPAEDSKRVESDNDVVLLSSEDECEPSTSYSQNDTESAHTNDLQNIANDDGRMLVNLGHPASEQDVFVQSHLTKVIKPHQLGGIRFLFDNLVESLERFSRSGGFGCILAHSMGLGKTLQVVTFVDIFYRYTPGKRVLILVPINTLQNWVHEFEHWLPKVADDPEIENRAFEVFVMGDKAKTPRQRSELINQWYEANGVLLMGYEMFRLLSNRDLNKSRKPPPSNSTKNIARSENVNLQPATTDSSTPAANSADPTNGLTHAVPEIEKKPTVDLFQALIDPGPDLIVCDEGHRIKNMQSNIAKVLNSIKTKRRVVLTGYPLQNNMFEYWCMVNFVRPNYLGSKHEFSNMFERPIKNGQCVDSTPEDVRVMRFRVHVLTNLLKGFVQRRSHSLLAGVLPPKQEFVLFLRKSEVQQNLYKRFVVQCKEEILDRIGSWNALKAFAICCKIWNHPDILYKVLKNREILQENDLDLGDINALTNENSNSSKPVEKDKNNTSSVTKPKKEDNMDYRWAEDIMDKYERGQIKNGFKLTVTLAILEQCVLRDDKLLLFSQSLFTLDLIEEFLSKAYVPGTTVAWKKNHSYFRLDGSTSSSEREKLISRFNNEKAAHLFLISTRAGSLGINLVSANRVIVYDASWNPCHDAQAVCRVYRYGQRKPTFIYRLVTDNSMERTIFNRQLGKQGMSERIIDEKPVDAQISRQDLYNLLQYEEHLDAKSDSLDLENSAISGDILLEDICRIYQVCLSQVPIHHESLLLDRSDQNLSAREKREARRNYEREKKAMTMEGGSKKTFAQIAKEFRLYSECRSMVPNKPNFDNFYGPSSRPMKLSPYPLSLQPPDRYNPNFTHRLIGDSIIPINPNRNSVQKTFAPCSLALPSAQVPGTSGVLTPNEPIDIIRRPEGVYVRTATGHYLDARGSIFDTNWTRFGRQSQQNGAVPLIKPLIPKTTGKPEEIVLSDDD